MDEVQLNTLYVMTEGAYLHRDGQTVVIELEKKVLGRIPLHMIDSIATFGHVMVSPGLMEACAESHVALNFLTTNGRVMARVDTPGGGGVVLRKAHYHRADDPVFTLALASIIVAGKIQNCRQNLLRSARDGEAGANAEALHRTADQLMYNVDQTQKATDLDVLRGLEGDAAHLYFQHFAMMTPDAPECLKFKTRSRQPPLDPINSLLSLFYSILTHDCIAALVAAGLDPSVGFLHQDRPGRPSLAVDLVEEFRPYLADRFVITLINRKQVSESDFITRPGGAVEMTEAARKRTIGAFQERKQERRQHPYLDQESPIGRFPALQAKIMARHIRGDLDHYVPLLIK